MKYITINLRGTSIHTMFENGEKADAAYSAVKKAMAEYREFGNDRNATVSFEAEQHGEHTFALRDIQGIYIQDMDDADDILVKHAVQQELIKRKIAAAVLLAEQQRTPEAT